MARVSEILGGWERVITEGLGGSEEGIVVFCVRGRDGSWGCCGLVWPRWLDFGGDENERLIDVRLVALLWVRGWILVCLV